MPPRVHGAVTRVPAWGGVAGQRRGEALPAHSRGGGAPSPVRWPVRRISIRKGVIEDAVMSVFWSATDAFMKGDKIHDVPGDNYKEETNIMLIHNLRHWRHCLAIGLGTARCWPLTPRFDDTTEKYNNYLDCRAALWVVDPTKVYSLRGKRDSMRFGNSGSTTQVDLRGDLLGMRCIRHLQ